MSDIGFSQKGAAGISGSSSLSQSGFLVLVSPKSVGGGGGKERRGGGERQGKSGKRAQKVVGWLEKGGKWDVGIELFWKPSLVQRELLKVSYLK